MLQLHPPTILDYTCVAATFLSISVPNFSSVQYLSTVDLRATNRDLLVATFGH